jgi:competence protein ComEA
MNPALTPEVISQVVQKLAPYKIPLFLGGISIFALGGALSYFSVLSFQREPIIIQSSVASPAAVAEQGIMIDVSGAVRHPGVVVLSFDARVIDAIEKAGGYTDTADHDRIAKTINLAQKVTDGMKLYIPPIEINTSHNISESVTGGGDTSHNLVTDTVGSSTININTASESDLIALPGIGPVTAQKIIKNRPYNLLDELVSKKAIGKKLFDELKNQLTL